jgi:hypothetical protein
MGVGLKGKEVVDVYKNVKYLYYKMNKIKKER